MARTGGHVATAGLALAALKADRHGKLPAMVGFLRGDELQAMFPLSVRRRQRRRQSGKIDSWSLVRTWEREEICALAKWLGLSEDRGRLLEDVSGATRPRRFVWHGRSAFPRRDRVAAWARLVPRTGLARDGAVSTKLELRRIHVRRPSHLQVYCGPEPSLRHLKAPPRRLSKTEALANELKVSRDQLAKANQRLILLLPKAAKASNAPRVDDREKAAAIAAIFDWFAFKRTVIAMGRLALHAQLERNRVQVRAWVRLAAARRLARHLYRRCVAYKMHAALRGWTLEIRRLKASEAAITLQRCARYFLARCRCHKVRRRRASWLAARMIQCGIRRLLVRQRRTARERQAALTIQRFAWSALHRAKWRQREQLARQRAATLALLQLQSAARRRLAQICYYELLTKRRNAVITIQRSARAALKGSDQRRKDYIAHQRDNAVPVVQRFVRTTYLPQRRAHRMEAQKRQIANLAASTIQRRVRTRQLAVRRADAVITIQRQCRGCLLRASVVVKRNALCQPTMRTPWPATTPSLAPESTLPLVPFVPLEAPVPVALSPSNMVEEYWCAEGEATHLNPAPVMAVDAAVASVIIIQSIFRGNATRATPRRSIASLQELQRTATRALLQGEKLKRQLAGVAATSTIARNIVHSYKRRRAAAAQKVQRVYRGSKTRASILYKRVTAIKNVQRVVRGYQARVATPQLHDIVSIFQERTRGSFVRRKMITRLRASAASVIRVCDKARQVAHQKADSGLATPDVSQKKPSCSPRTLHNPAEWRNVATMTNVVEMKNCATQPIDNYDDDTFVCCDAHNTIARQLQPVVQIWLARRKLNLRRRARAAQDAVASFVCDLVFPKQTTDSWTSPMEDTGIDIQVTRSCATQSNETKTVEQKDQGTQSENIMMYAAAHPETLVAAKVDGYWEMRDAYVTAQNSTYRGQSIMIQRAWRTRLGRRKRCALIQALCQRHILSRSTLKSVRATVTVQSAREKSAAFEVAQLEADRVEALDKIEHRAAAAIQARARGIKERSLLRDKNELRLQSLSARNQVRRAEVATAIQCWTRQVQARQVACHRRQERRNLEEIERKKKVQAATVIQCWTRQVLARQVACCLRQQRRRLEETIKKEREFESATLIQCWTRVVQARQVACYLRQERRTLEETMKKVREFESAILIQCWTRLVQARRVACHLRQERRTLLEKIEKEREFEASIVVQCWTRQVQARQIARHLRQQRRTLETIEKEREVEAAIVVQCRTRQVQAREVARNRQEQRRLEARIEKEREFDEETVVQCWKRQVQARQVTRNRQESRTLEATIDKEREFNAATVILCWTRQAQARLAARHLRRERRTREEAIEKEREFEAALDKMKRDLELELFAMRIQNGFRRYVARCRLEQQVRALVEAEQTKIRTHRSRSASSIQALARGVRQRSQFQREKGSLRDAKVIRAALFRMKARSKSEIERIEARLKHLARFGPSEYLWSSVRAELGTQEAPESQIDSNSTEVLLPETANGTSHLYGDNQPSSYYGWIQQYDDSAQATYWYNTITGEASWLEPTDYQQDTYPIYEAASYYNQGDSIVSPGDYYSGAGAVNAAPSEYYYQPNMAVGMDQAHQWYAQPQGYGTAADTSYLYDGAAAQYAQHVSSTDYYDMHT